MTRTPVEETLFGRRSVRAYRGTPVPRPDIERICRAARTAPSGANLQPGVFHVLTGAALAGLSRALLAAIDAGVFGAPTYVVEGEMFWGQDRLDFLQRKLGL